MKEKEALSGPKRAPGAAQTGPFARLRARVSARIGLPFLSCFSFRKKRASRFVLQAEGESAGSGSKSLALRCGERLCARSIDSASMLPDIRTAFPVHDCLVMAFRAEERKVLEHRIRQDLGARLASAYGAAHPSPRINAASHGNPPLVSTSSFAPGEAGISDADAGSKPSPSSQSVQKIVDHPAR